MPSVLGAACLVLVTLCEARFGVLRSLEPVRVDAALILAVDISQSVDEDRYRLQMEGMAKALENEAVADAITSGPYGRIAIQFIVWADGVETLIPWQIISSRKNALTFAGLIRRQTHRAGEYTCMARMMRIVDESMLDELPFTATRTILDISGDGIDNCAEPQAVNDARDRLVGRGVTVNGLPIIVSGENDVVGAGAYREPGFGLRPLSHDPGLETTLEHWFKDHVIGGRGAFVQPSQGYEEISRAFQQKFLTEISSTVFEPGRDHREADGFAASPARQ